MPLRCPSLCIRRRFTRCSNSARHWGRSPCRARLRTRRHGSAMAATESLRMRRPWQEKMLHGRLSWKILQSPCCTAAQEATVTIRQPIRLQRPLHPRLSPRLRMIRTGRNCIGVKARAGIVRLPHPRRARLRRKLRKLGRLRLRQAPGLGRKPRAVSRRRVPVRTPIVRGCIAGMTPGTGRAPLRQALPRLLR